MEYLKQFRSHIGNNDLPSLVSLWQEYCLSDEIEPEELRKILEAIKESSLSQSFSYYVEEILPLWETLPQSKAKHEAFSLIYDIQMTNSKKLSDLAINYLEARYPNDKNMNQKLRLVGLKDFNVFQGAIRNFDLLTHMEVGNFFIHTGGWGVGEVMEVSMLREQITLEFDLVAGFKELSFENAFKNLVPISNDHFLARRFGDAENFEKFAREKPVETIRMLLRDLGPKTASEIKDEMCDLIIPEEDWTKWWSSTRSKLKKDTMIETPSNQKEPFRLRETEVSHEERLHKELAKKPKPNTLIEKVYSFIRDFPAALKDEDFKATLRNHLTEVLTSKEITDSQELQILFILQDLGHEKAQDLGEIIERFANLGEVVSRVNVIAYRKRLLVEIRNRRKDWEEVFAGLICEVDQNPLRDYLLDELMQAGREDFIHKEIEKLLDEPTKAPPALLWYFQKALSNKKYPLSDQMGLDRLFEAFFILLHRIETDSDMKELVKKMYQFLSNGRFANVRKIFQGASEPVVKEILLLSTKCQTLSEHDIKILHSLAEVVHPNLSKLRKVHSEEEEENVVWTTEEGFRKIKERIEEIATVETVENAKEIEIARSHGDLRENSEYKYAQEKRARLQGELRFLSSQIKLMRVLTKADIDTSQISVGTVVRLKNSAGKQINYTLLGPWDADPDKGVISFQSKIANDLIGKRIGEKIEIQNQEWEVEEIKSFL